MLGSFWEPLGEHLEYSVYLTESTDVQPQESSNALRAKQGTVNRFEYVLEGRHIGGIPRQGGCKRRGHDTGHFYIEKPAGERTYRRDQSPQHPFTIWSDPDLDPSFDLELPVV